MHFNIYTISVKSLIKQIVVQPRSSPRNPAGLRTTQNNKGNVH